MYFKEIVQNDANEPKTIARILISGMDAFYNG